MLKAEFVQNNAQNTNIGYRFFKLNCTYHPHIFLEDKFDSCFRSCSTNELVKKLKKLILIYQQNLVHAQEPPKRVHNRNFNFVATHQVEMFGLIANISKQREIKSLRPYFSIYFEFSIQCASVLISLNYLSFKKFMMFFIYHCQNQILQESGKLTSCQSQNQNLI